MAVTLIGAARGKFALLHIPGCGGMLFYRMCTVLIGTPRPAFPGCPADIGPISHQDFKAAQEVAALAIATGRR